MRKTFLFAVAVLMTASLILGACGGSAATQAPASQYSPAPAVAEKVTLKVLVHQNPPMVEFMTKFNDEFKLAPEHHR